MSYMRAKSDTTDLPWQRKPARSRTTARRHTRGAIRILATGLENESLAGPSPPPVPPSDQNDSDLPQPIEKRRPSRHEWLGDASPKTGDTEPDGASFGSAGVRPFRRGTAAWLSELGRCHVKVPWYGRKAQDEHSCLRHD